jgi:hypothetical protein
MKTSLDSITETLNKQSSDELLHKFNNSYFSDDARQLARKILESRGINVSVTAENSQVLTESNYYTGETNDERIRGKHRQLASLISFISPLLSSGIAWIGTLYAEKYIELSLLQWLTGALTLFASFYILYTSYKFITKFSKEDFIVYPTVVIYIPSTIYLSFYLIVSPFVS